MNQRQLRTVDGRSSVRQRRRSQRFAGLAIVLATGFAACSSDSEPSSTSEAGSNSAPTTTVAATTATTTAESGATTAGSTASTDPVDTSSPSTVVASSVVVPEGLDFDQAVTLSVGLPVGSMDPAKAASGFDRFYMSPVYDSLLYANDDGSLTPMLATEWEFADDLSSLTLTLRDDVTFHDGTPFDAAAVKANLERSQTVEGSTIAAQMSSITSVEVVDATTVQLNLTGPVGTLLQILADRVGMMISPAALGNADLDRVPVGSGPWEVAEVVEGESVRYTSVEGYWKPEWQLVNEVEVRAGPDDEQRLNSLLAGELDITYIGKPQFARVEGEDLERHVEQLISSNRILLNTSRSEFADPKVRQAISHALDRTSIVDATFGEERCPASLQLFSEAFAYHSTELPTVDDEYDEELARQLLTEAGLPDGFTFELLVPQNTDYIPVGELIKAQLAEVGITVNLQVLPSADIRRQYREDKSADAALLSYPGSASPLDYYRDVQLATGFENPGGLEVPGMQELYEQAIASTDSDEQADLAHEMAELGYAEPGAEITICTPTYVIVANPLIDFTVGGNLIKAGGYADFRGIGKRSQ